MNELHALISSAIDYRITWCEQHRAEAYRCDWRIDPCLVIIYTLDNHYRLFVKKEEGVHRFEAQRGQALLVPAGTLHRIEAPASEIRGINIQFSLFGGIDVLSFYQTPSLVSGPAAHGLRQNIEQLITVIGRRSSLYSIDTEESSSTLDIGAVSLEHQYAFQLLSQVIELSALKPQGNQRVLLMQKLQPALQLVEDKLREKLTVDQLADACALSTHRFSTLFKKTLGDSPHRFILKRRLEQAMSLLSHSDHSVTEIANQLGFYDQPHFTKLFKSHTGRSPAFYRQDIQRRVVKGRRE